MSRFEILEKLKVYFCSELAEDRWDGTTFDCDVIDAIERLGEKYKDD